MVERKTLNLVVEGSIPSEGGFFFFAVPTQALLIQLPAPTQALLIHHSSLRFIQPLHKQNKCGRLAQLVEHWSNKPRVAGSSPVVTIFVLCQKNKSFVRDKKSPSVGIEPTAIGLKGQRSTV